MDRFKVTGIDSETGESKGFDVEADSVMEAQRIAHERGLRHVAIMRSQVLPLDSADPGEERSRVE